ncbi:MAG: hypothetical protein Pg6C_10160 [Treponemataceae bacterium]|jgi:phage baseplate assembly protein W|nr:MAG: hypothetical protein Pg6C_10160 [Treponemataceae bacterium]
MDYGTDFLLVEDDVVFTAEGDIALVSGAATVAQDIDQTLKTATGALYWDRDIGSTMPLFLNGAGANANAVIAELERVAIADARVDPDSVKAYQTTPGKFRLDFAPLAAVKTETLEYDLTKGRET